MAQVAELPQLSRRESEVAGLAARGLSNADIANQLTLSVRTVESHLYRAFAKLGVAHRRELAELLGRTSVVAHCKPDHLAADEPTGSTSRSSSAASLDTV